ncbi:hypothetical protein HYDPIDRAFT_39686 [Hydnomerulius pinastri MD-312]|uniref:F-box domain-containing protein n=1 Tax=Hydnomerulius pinastri MD-312 TaxID=994086 RepID=A0A0C9W251_9AGAM|nr:hypothetical protein HYDPIDRAFT_39686 [Hydnomerulius pinastri MD-312]
MSPPNETTSVFDRLPNELLLEFFTYVPLQTLIHSRGVCSKWRSLTMLSDLLPMRRRLLDLYLSVIESSVFLATRQETLSKLQTFDREQYIRNLGGSLPQFVLPEEFEFYIREWPLKAAVAWPCFKDILDHYRARNLLHPNRFADDEDVYEYDENSVVTSFRVIALELWMVDSRRYHFLVCDKTKDSPGRIHFGKVYSSHSGMYLNQGPIAGSWIEWLEQRVKEGERQTWV